MEQEPNKTNSTDPEESPDEEEINFTPDPARHISCSDPRLPAMLEAGKSRRNSFPALSREQVLIALKELPEWLTGRDVVEGLGLKPQDLSHCMIVGLRAFSSKSIGQAVCHPWGFDDEMRAKSRAHLISLEHRNGDIVPPRVFGSYAHVIPAHYSVPEWQCLTIPNPDNPAESEEMLLEKHMKFLFRTMDVLKFQKEYGFPVCSEKLKRCWKNLILKDLETRRSHIKSADGKWILLANDDLSAVTREVDRIAPRVRFTGFIDPDHLALALAVEEEHNKEVLPALFGFFRLDEMNTDSINQRIEAWRYLIDYWRGAGDFFFVENRSVPIDLIDQYRYSKAVGKYEKVERGETLYPQGIDESVYVKLDDIGKLAKEIKQTAHIDVVLPPSLFRQPRFSEKEEQSFGEVAKRRRTETQKMYDKLVPKAEALIAKDPDITWEDLTASLATAENFDGKQPPAITHIEKELRKRGVRCKRGRRRNK